MQAKVLDTGPGTQWYSKMEANKVNTDNDDSDDNNKHDDNDMCCVSTLRELKATS